MKKLLCISHCYPTKEMEHSGIFVKELNDYLSKDNSFSISVVAPKEHSYSFFGRIKNVLSLCYQSTKEIIVNKPDVIHAHWWLPGGLIGAALSFVFRIPLVISLHGADVFLLEKYPKCMFLLDYFVFSRAKKLIPVSNFIKELVPERFHNKCTVLPMPIQSRYSNKDYTPSKSWRILFPLGRLNERKGIGAVADFCFTKLSRGLKNVKVVVVGNKTKENRIGFIHGTDDVILPAIPHSRMLQEISKADIVVLPSRNEPFGMVIPEAQLLGKTVIGRNSGALPELITDGINGFLFDKNEELYELVQYIITELPKRERIYIEINAMHSASQYTFGYLGYKWKEILDV